MHAEPKGLERVADFTYSQLNRVDTIGVAKGGQGRAFAQPSLIFAQPSKFFVKVSNYSSYLTATSII